MDDFAIFTKSRSLPSAVRQMQLAINKCHKWTTQHGFVFSQENSVSMHFTRIRGVFPDLSHELGDLTIKQAQTQKFLGLILDTKQNWIPHLKHSC